MADVLDLGSLEPNIPPTDFGLYTTSLAAPPKFGKSTWCTLYSKPLIFDFEEGTMGKVVFRVPIAKWAEVKKYIRQLVSKPELKEKYNTICFDTVNYALEGCKQYIIDNYQSDHPEKLIDTFNKIPYGGGNELLSKEFKGEINKLKRAGYGIVLVSHIKDKTFGKETENEYSKTVPDLTDKERNMISAMADFLLIGDFETSTLEAAKKNDKDKVIKDAVVETKRVLYLRTNESAEAGFRWPGCPEKIPFDFDEFKRVFSEAVMEEIEQGKDKFKLSDSKITDIRNSLDLRRETEQLASVEEELSKDKLEKEKERSEKEKAELDDIVINIMALAKELQANNTDVKAINKILDGDPRSLTSVDKAKDILDKLGALEKNII